MSWVSSFWQRNGSAIQSIAKPFVSKIPIVGDTIASRINMSPTANQEALSTQAAVAGAVLTPQINRVNADAAANNVPATHITAPSNNNTMLMIGGAVLLLILVLMMTRK